MSPLFKTFPVFVIRVGSGYASVSTPDSPEDAPEFATLVFTAEKLAENFIAAAELEDAEVRFLREERELAKVLTSMKEPYTHMALDTVMTPGEDGGWHLETTCYPIPDVLRFHLLRARAPWDYPVYFLEMPNGGYVGFQGNIVAMFTTYAQAKEFRKKMASSSGVTIFKMETPWLLREFLATSQNTDVISINPVMNEDGTYAAKQNMTVESFLRHFLI